MGLFDNRRAATPEWQNSDSRIRKAAVARLADASLLAQVATQDSDDTVRAAAEETLLNIALASDPGAARTALQALSGEAALVTIARTATLEEIARGALDRLDKPHALALVVKKGSHETVRKAALDRLDDLTELGDLARKLEEKDLAMSALGRLESLLGFPGTPSGSAVETLSVVAERARNKAVSRRARLLAQGGEAEPAVAPKASSDRARQIHLCEAMESLCRSTEAEGMQDRIEGLRGDWIDLVPNVDPDLEERFEALRREAKEHLRRLEIESSERHVREVEAAAIHRERVAPRLELIRRLESMKDEEIERDLEEIRGDWDRIRFLETEEGELLRARFEKALASCEGRLGAVHSARREAEARERQEAATREKERRESESTQRLEQLCRRGEKALAAETANLRSVTRLLQDLRAALRSIEPDLPRRDKATFKERLTGLQAALSRRLIDLRQSEDWKLWANEGIQREICEQAESLAALEDALEASRQLKALEERWKQACTVSRGKSQELWLRFRGARDSIRGRAEAGEQEQWNRKEALCIQAEALAASSDWIATSEALKRLQSEWKTIGSAGRSRDQALWRRFRTACDQFFTRRKTDLKQRKEEWSKNLHARIALCEQAEALADSSDWDATAAALKKLQADWKEIGPTGRKDSETTWLRFRGACDRFFDRYKRRHQIEKAVRLEAREALCREVEALQTPGSPPPDALPDLLRGFQKRWAEAGSVAASEATALEERFLRALEGVIAAFPEALRETEFDVTRNTRRMEELIAQVEKLVPETMGSDASALSPATRLATLWVEAMAANTIGGSVAQEAQRRAAQDEVRRSQSAWEKIGFVSPALRRELTEKFQRACSRILKEGAEPAAAPLSPARLR
jgi:hypothetical protein